MKKRLLFISTIFPSKLANKHATYSMQLLSALTDYYDIDIINPIPWTHRIKEKINYVESLNGMEIYHPTYWYTPGMLRSQYGFFYYASVKTCALRMMNDRSYDVAIASWLYPDGWAAANITRTSGLPLYLIALGTDVNRLIKHSKVALHTIEAVSQSIKTFCMSHALREKLTSIGAQTEKLLVMYNGVNRTIFQKTDKDRTRRDLGFSGTEKIILFVGNLLRTKGLDELSDALAIIRNDYHVEDIKLVVAGTGSYESALNKRVKSNGTFDKTVFMGSCSLPIVAQLMNAADVVCLPSYNEGLPNVVLEALCCNAKIVATHVGGIPELQATHKNLYLIPPKDAKKLADMLITAITADCHEDSADDIYSWKEQADKLAALIMK
jgi:glycosyltransferase involved in cell wall biosynthesis